MTLYRATLYDSVTGTRFVHDEEVPDLGLHDCFEAPDCADYHEEWMWNDGNFGCDCNRLSFMGIEDERECGHTVILESLVNVATGASPRTEEY